MPRGAPSRWSIRVLTLFMGVALLVCLIARTGAGSVIEHVKAIGWAGLLVILALGGISHLLRAWAWRLSFCSDVCSLSIGRAFALRLISEATGNFGLAGQVVGDAMRISLIGPTIPMADRISSVALDRGAYIVNAATLSVAGILAAVTLPSLTGAWRTYALMFAGALTMMVVLVFVTFAKSWRVASHITHAVQRLPRARKWLGNKVSVIESAEENLLSFRRRAPNTFRAVMALYFASQLLAIAEVYLLLRFMGVGITSVGAFIIEAFTKLISLVGALNPGNIGTYEGGNVVLARLLGFTAAAGLTLALCRRARALFWAGIGALCLIAFSRGKRQFQSGSVDGSRTGKAPQSEIAASTDVSEMSRSGPPGVIILARSGDKREDFIPALARVGTLPVLLRAILGVQSMGAGEIVVLVTAGNAQHLRRDLQATGRLPEAVEWREGSQATHLPMLVREIADSSDRLVLVLGDRTYHPELLRIVNSWNPERGPLALTTDGELAGISVFSRGAAIELASQSITRIATLDELHLWRSTNGSVTRKEVARESWHAVQTAEDQAAAEHKLDTWLFKPTDGQWARRNRRISIPISRQLIKLPITPNMVTVFVLAVGIAAGLSFARGGYWNTLLGALLSLSASILDGCDGEVARLKLQSSEFGCWLETICDYFYYLIIFTGLAFGLARSSGTRAYLVWGALLLFGSCLSFLTVGALRQDLGGDRPERFLAIWQKQAESRKSNPLLYLGRHTEFLIRRCFFPYALLAFALLNQTKLIFVMTAIGANLVWVIALHSRIVFSRRGSSPLHVADTPMTPEIAAEVVSDHGTSD